MYYNYFANFGVHTLPNIYNEFADSGDLWIISFLNILKISSIAINVDLKKSVLYMILRPSVVHMLFHIDLE